ncbi:MAG: heparinase II/III family protein [Planctomycetota bacterium]|jgi:hypothetical protein|nr:heparinase II/III family protein [Planctomycetota bacterium]
MVFAFLFLIRWVACEEPPGAYRDFTIKEYLNHDWPSQILNYRVAFKERECHVGSLILIELDSGKTVPFQLSSIETWRRSRLKSATLSFFGSLPANKNLTWRLFYGPKKARVERAESTLLHGNLRRNPLALSNSKIAVQVAGGKKKFRRPVPVREVPPPLQKVKGVDQVWRGQGRWASGLKVREYQCQLIEEGPVFLEYEVKYTFDPDGDYTFRMRLYREQNYFTVSERFNVVEGAPVPRDRNLNRIPGDHHTPPDKLTHFQFSVYRDFEPDQEQRILNEVMPVQSLAYDADKVLVWLQSYCLWTRVDLWRPFFSVFSSDAAKKDYLSVFTIHPGHWEDPTVAAGWTGPERNAIGAYLRKTPDVFFDFPVTEGTREWGMLLTHKASGGEINPVRIALSEVPLDLVKDWVLEWPRDDSTKRPRLWFHESERETIRRRLQHPKIRPLWDKLIDQMKTGRGGEPSVLGLLYFMTGDKRYALRARHSLLSGVGANLRDYSYKYLRWGKQNGFRVSPVEIRRMSGYGYGWDALVDSGVFSEAEIREVRARMAFIAYTLSSKDYMAWQFAVGNADFDADRYSIVGSFGLALPDHPHSSQWVEHAVSQFNRQMKFYVSEGSGRWIENPGNYYLHTWRVLTPFLLALHHLGDDRGFGHPKFRQFCDFAVKTITPAAPSTTILKDGPPKKKTLNDTQRVRMVPGIGDTGPIGPDVPSMPAFAAHAYSRIDPALSQRLMWAWRQGKGQLSNLYFTLTVPSLLFINHDLPNVPPKLASETLPEYGAVMRAEFGTPRESYLLFKSGIGGARFHNDELAFILYLRGVPVTLDGGFGWSTYKGSLHSTVTFDGNDYFMPRGDLARFVTLEGADLAVGRMPPSPPHFSRFDRHILFVKNDYFLIRDDIETQQATAWHLPMAVKDIEIGEGQAVGRGRLGMDFLVRFLLPGHPPELDVIGAAVPGHKTLRARRKKGGPYYAAIVPEAGNEKWPEIDSRSDGLVTVNSSKSSDWIVLNPWNIKVEHEDFRFEGRCGVARKGTDGSISLALVDGKQIALGPFRLASDSVSAEVVRHKNGTIHGTTFGKGGEVLIYPGDAKAIKKLIVKIKNRKVPANVEDKAIRFKVAAGRLRFEIASE